MPTITHLGSRESLTDLRITQEVVDVAYLKPDVETIHINFRGLAEKMKDGVPFCVASYANVGLRKRLALHVSLILYKHISEIVTILDEPQGKKQSRASYVLQLNHSLWDFY